MTNNVSEKVKLLSILFEDDNRRDQIEALAEEVAGVEQEISAWAFEFARFFRFVSDYRVDLSKQFGKDEIDELLGRVPDWITHEISE